MCTKPIPAWQLLPKHWDQPEKAPQPIFKRPNDLHRYVSVPLSCRKCVSCLKVRSMTLAVQLGCELQTTIGESQFITLTYDPEHLPQGHTLNKIHPQLFLKSLRNWLTKHYPGIKIRYKLVGEYGENSFRPHYHLAIFGLPNFEDQQISDKNYSESNKLYESEILTEIWGKGNVVYNHLTPASCLYIAQHSDKKINRQVDYSMELIDAQTGEIIEPPILRFNKKDKQNRLIRDENGKPQTELLKQRVPEFTTGSSKPGLGTEWFIRFGKTDLHQGMIMSLDAQHHKIPRHLMNLLEREIPDLYTKLQADAKAYAIRNKRTQKELDYQDNFDNLNLKYKQKRNKI